MHRTSTGLIGTIITTLSVSSNTVLHYHGNSTMPWLYLRYSKSKQRCYKETYVVNSNGNGLCLRRICDIEWTYKVGCKLVYSIQWWNVWSSLYTKIYQPIYRQDWQLTDWLTDWLSIFNIWNIYISLLWKIDIFTHEDNMLLKKNFFLMFHR